MESRRSFDEPPSTPETSSSNYDDVPDSAGIHSTMPADAKVDTTSAESIALALSAPDIVGPRVYELVDVPMSGDEFSILVIGCTGDDSDGSRAIGKMMGEHDAHIIFHAGDALYKRGLQNLADTTVIEKILLDPYPAKKKTFYAAGNHDVGKYNIANKTVDYVVGSAANPLRNLNALTFYDKRIEVVKEKIQFFSQRVISYTSKLLGRINYPYPFYSLIIGKKHQFIFLNTCTILQDFIRYHELVEIIKKGEPDSAQVKAANLELERNQIAWLLVTMHDAMAANMQVALIGHHPPEPSTNRATTNDDKFEYFNITEYQTLIALLGLDPGKSYNMYKLISAMYLLLKIFPFQVFAAHEHCTHITNTLLTNPENPHPLRQCVAGGGGDREYMQFRETHKNFPATTSFRPEPAVVKVTYNLHKHMTFLLEVFSLDKLEHHYSESSHLSFYMQPGKLKSLNVIQLLKLRQCVCNAYDAYCYALKDAEQSKAAKKENDQVRRPDARPINPPPPATQTPSTYSWTGLKATFFRGVKAVKDFSFYVMDSTNRAYSKKNRDTNFEDQLIIIQYIYAYFTQFHLIKLNFKVCSDKLSSLIDDLTTLVNTINGHPSGIVFIKFLNIELKKAFDNTSLPDEPAVSAKPRMSMHSGQ